MNKKGLTLVELMAVIVVLAVIALIVTPNVLKEISKYHNKMYDTQINNIISAAKNWAIDEINEKHCLICVPENNLVSNIDCNNGGEGCIESKDPGSSTVVFLSTLIDDGYLKDDLENPKTGKPFSRCLMVQISIDSVTKEYNYTIPNAETTEACSR